jgi:hypothetical protein
MWSNVNPDLGNALGNIRAQQSNVSAAGSGGAAMPVRMGLRQLGR